MNSHEACLGAANTRTLRNQAHVARKSHSPGMGGPLTVKDNHIWLSGNLPEGLCQYRCLAKGQESGHIRELHRISGQGLIGQDKIGKTEDQHCRIDFSAFLCIGNIGPGNGPYRFFEGRLPNLTTKAPLNGYRVLTRKVPGM